MANGQEKATLKGHTSGVNAVAFSSDGRTLASAGIQIVKLWDVASGQEKATLKGHTAGINSVAFSSDGRTLASAGVDEIVRLWRGATDAEVARNCIRCGRKD
jgi:WD40 repeat protein